MIVYINDQEILLKYIAIDQSKQKKRMDLLNWRISKIHLNEYSSYYSIEFVALGYIMSNYIIFNIVSIKKW